MTSDHPMTPKVLVAGIQELGRIPVLYRCKPARLRYCEFCAWKALTPETREYCSAETPGLLDLDQTAECTRMPGHDGPHVMCVTGWYHKLASWREPELHPRPTERSA